MKVALVAALAASLAAGAAMAQPGYGDHDRGDMHGGPGGPGDRGPGDRGPGGHDHGPGGPGPGPGRHWGRGQRLPGDYNRYEVSDWRAHRLPPPRRGYHWVRSGDDYVLAAVATGVIASVIANANY